MRPKHIVILGGGFGGVALANALARQRPARTRVTLLSEENFMVYSPLLSEVVGGSLLPAHAVAPIRQLLHDVTFHRVRVTGVDLDASQVLFQGGIGHLEFDDLVLACGLRSRLDVIPGMGDYGFPLRGLGDALELRNRVLLQLERAELETDPGRRRRLMRFAVVGGGASGVETAGAINDFLRAACRHYPALDSAALGVCLVHAGERLIDELPGGLGDFARRHMERRGVDVRLGA
ncbi:MAG: FAD-dependent oxidoreductase, partial [Chromatiales bacterium]